MKPSVDYQEYLLSRLRDPEEARIYLEIALEEYAEDQDAEAFLMALENVAEAQGGLSLLAERAQVSRENLEHLFTRRDRPGLSAIEAVLRGLGFRLAVAYAAPQPSQPITEPQAG